MVTEIWYLRGWKNIKPDEPVNTMRAMYSFSIANCLPGGGLVKSQGGYYLIQKDGTMKFVTRTLYLLTFKELYDLYQPKALEKKDQAPMDSISELNALSTQRELSK